MTKRVHIRRMTAGPERFKDEPFDLKGVLEICFGDAKDAVAVLPQDDGSLRIRARNGRLALWPETAGTIIVRVEPLDALNREDA